MCPWPDIATLGIQKPRGLTEAESKSVPDCVRTGVKVRFEIWYHRDALRPPPTAPTPLELTSMLWAVQRLLTPVVLFLWMAAPKRRKSRASRGLTEPIAGWSIGKVVVGTVRRIFAEIDGVPPGLLILRIAS